MKVNEAIQRRIDDLKKPIYLGDGVEASFDGFQVLLKTWDGYEYTNEIAIEPHVQIALGDYFKWLEENCDQIRVMQKESENVNQ